MQGLNEKEAKLAVSGAKFIWGYREAKTNQEPVGQRMCLSNIRCLIGSKNQ